ncbi:MAG: IS1634 family transposase [Alphaproteobacteria bacterium]|nr:IS1634 family transposase [Alphaproteobacteria bacterium]
MFFRRKKSGNRTYLQIVENRRQGGRVRQRVLLTLGRLDELTASGALDALLSSGARFSEPFAMLAAAEADAEAGRLSCLRIGPPLLFGRLWKETGIGAVLDELLNDRGFEFPVERAIFVAVLHRLFVSGSDRACEKWLADYRIDGAEDLQLHHFYRAMAWLGEELAAEDQAGATGQAGRCVKDAVEEALFARRRDLFSDLSVVFMDTTSLSFTGAGGATLGARGYSKDHRPELMQMILGVVIDDAGRPVCTEMWPGNTADVTVLVPIVDRLRSRFGIGRVCVVADRGMISGETIAALEERGMEYILGARERSDGTVRDVVLRDGAPFIPLVVERAGGKETELEAKSVTVGGVRYIVCRNPAEARKDAADRAAILEGLEKQLAKGDKALIGNSAYRRFITTTKACRFEVDHEKAEAEARFDGISVLRTNTTLNPLSVMLRYRDLLMVEALFRSAKSLLRTRPIYHSSDAAIRGHVFCSFLALVLRKELMERCRAAGLKPEWIDVLLDLNRLQEATIERGPTTYTIRTEATGCVSALFKAVRLALPPRLRTNRPSPARKPESTRKNRRGTR